MTMRGTEILGEIQTRLEAHPLVIQYALPVYTEAEHYDLEAVLIQELAKGGLHLVVALGGLVSTGAASRNAAPFTREAIVTLAYVPGLSPPPIVPVALSEALAPWLHGHQLVHAPRAAWLTLTDEAPLPEGGDVAGRQLTLTFPVHLVAGA